MVATGRRLSGSTDVCLSVCKVETSFVQRLLRRHCCAAEQRTRPKRSTGTLGSEETLEERREQQHSTGTAYDVSALPDAQFVR